MIEFEAAQILASVREIADEFQRIAGSRWSVSSVADDRIDFRHKEFTNISYSICIRHLGMIEGKCREYRDIEFGSISSRGSFMIEDKKSFEYYALVGSLVSYPHLEELRDKIKAIPLFLDEEF